MTLLILFVCNEAVNYPTLVRYMGSDAASMGICFHLSFGMNKTVKKDRHIFDFKLHSGLRHNTMNFQLAAC